MCGVPSPVRAVHQHSLTREGERLIPMVFALPAVVDTPPRQTARTDFLGVPQGRMLCNFSWVSPRGECCRFCSWVSPRGECCRFCSWASPRGECCRFVFPGCPPSEDAVQFFLAILWRHAARFFLDPSLTEGRPLNKKLNSRSQTEDIESIIIRSKIPFILSTRRDLKHCCGYPCDILMNSYRLGVPLLFPPPLKATRPTKQVIVKSNCFKIPCILCKLRDLTENISVTFPRM